MSCTFIFEPGRVIAGNAGILVTGVLYTKTNEGKNFVIVDAGMNDLIRPSLYNSYHQIQPVVKKERATVQADIVGPICESGDYLAKGRDVPEFERGELMAVMSAGAYGFTMSSNYNSRPRVAEVLVQGEALVCDPAAGNVSRYRQRGKNTKISNSIKSLQEELCSREPLSRL